MTLNYLLCIHRIDDDNVANRGRSYFFDFETEMMVGGGVGVFAGCESLEKKL